MTTTFADGASTSTFWFALALVNAGLAQSKRRSRLVWFLLSLFLGPIATLVIVMLGYGPPRADRPS